MYMRTFLLALLLGQALLISCSSDGMYSAAPENSSAMEEDFIDDYSKEQPASTPQDREQQEEPEQQLVLLRTANSRMEVDDIQDKVQHIESLLAQKSGYVANLEWRNYGNQEEAQLSLRIPAKHFDWLLDTIAGLAVKVNYQEVTTRDVTEEYVDLQTRLKTKKAVRDRYEEILRTKAETVEDILKTEEKLRRLQEEIEAKEGRLRYLTQRAEFSTISLQLYEPYEEVAGTPWWQDFGDDIGNSLAFSLNLIKGLFLGLLSLWPILLILGLLIWRRKKIWRRLRPNTAD